MANSEQLWKAYYKGREDCSNHRPLAPSAKYSEAERKAYADGYKEAKG